MGFDYTKCMCLSKVCFYLNLNLIVKWLGQELKTLICETSSANLMRQIEHNTYLFVSSWNYISTKNTLICSRLID